MNILPEFQAWLDSERAKGLTMLRVGGERPGDITVITLNAGGASFGSSDLSVEAQKAILEAEQAIAGRDRVIGD